MINYYKKYFHSNYSAYKSKGGSFNQAVPFIQATKFKSSLKLLLLLATFFVSSVTYSQVIYSTHTSPQADTHYVVSSSGGCSPCSVTDPENGADTSLSNYAVVSAAGTNSARSILKLKLTDTADVGANAGIAMKRSGSANPAILSKITINTYYNNTLQESKTGSALSTFFISTTSGIRAIEFTGTKKFNYVEVEVHRSGGGNNSIDLYYAYGENPTPLPVELISFDAVIENDFVRIKWATASEHNHKHFIVEKSTDGRKFIILDEIESNGNSTNTKHYSTIDFEPADTNYYRLLQIDENGGIYYSNTVKVCFKHKLGVPPKISAYPNPATDVLTIDAENLPKGSIIEIKTLDSKLCQSQLLKKGDINFVNIVDLQPGIYLVTITTPHNKVVYKERLIKI